MLGWCTGGITVALEKEKLARELQHQQLKLSAPAIINVHPISSRFYVHQEHLIKVIRLSMNLNNLVHFDLPCQRQCNIISQSTLCFPTDSTSTTFQPFFPKGSFTGHTIFHVYVGRKWYSSRQFFLCCCSHTQSVST